ncbi:MAG: helix-turn-helix domain-containing protein [Erysipelotrichaceae bacterium]|nr:helix-turn-helix domain-containing protein [Erysipelotrichaceae bacterium]
MGTTVGLSRVTVTNVLNEFVKKGYIENKYRKIIVKDDAGLAQLLIKD